MKSIACFFRPIALLVSLSLVLISTDAHAGFWINTRTPLNPSFASSSVLTGYGVVQAANGTLYGLTEASGNYGFGSVAQITPAAQLSVFASFQPAGPAAAAYGNLILGTNNDFYGTANFGSASNSTLFNLSSTGTLTNIATYGSGADGDVGLASRGSDGSFYIVTPTGGTNTNGCIYKIDPTGVTTTFYTFNGTNDGGNPQTSLLEGSNGLFYGAAFGSSLTNVANGGAGIFYSLSPSGQWTNLFTFGGTNGAQPVGRLAMDTGGNFYGVTHAGGLDNLGVVYKITPAGVFTVLANFTNGNGGNPVSGLVKGSDGNFYGATSTGGAHADGTIFRVIPSGVMTTLHSFDGKDGAYPNSLTYGQDGNFYGTTPSSVFKISPAARFTLLVRPTPSYPSDLIRDGNGLFYGTSAAGGDNGAGSIFRLTPAGIVSIYSMATNIGESPQTLLHGLNGDFYGLTATGGGLDNLGAGTLFRMTPGGKTTPLFTFSQITSPSPNGYLPTDLIQARDGDFYGTTYGGGTPPDGSPSGHGTVFKMTPRGQFTTLTSFDGTNGANPLQILQARDGNFYGITQALLPGSTNANATAFKMTPAGIATALFTFDTNSGTPPRSLLQGKDGNFYGTTGGSGSNFSGSFFELTPDGDFTYVYIFSGSNNPTPWNLVEAADGSFYCSVLTDANTGAIYRITPSGSALQLTAFSGPDGAGPITLATAPGVKLYGATQSGGPRGGGTCFSLGQANYSGLFYETDNVNANSAGYFRITLSLDFHFTGVFVFGEHKHPVAGQFDPETLTANWRIKPFGAPLTTINLQLAPDGNSVSGTLSNRLWIAQLLGKSSVDYTVNNPAAEAGTYNFILSGADGGGSGHTTVTKDGTILLSAVLGDRSAATQETFIDSDGQWALYAPLYHGKGALLGWVGFTNTSGWQFGGTVIWTKLSEPYPSSGNGFTNTMTVQGVPTN